MTPRNLTAALAALAAAALLTATPHAVDVASASPSWTNATSTAVDVTYDRYSLMVDGERVFLWTGEFHYFRLPSPDLWRDVLERIRAAGFNGVSLYFNWAYHSPAPGVYDFTGVRDVDRLLRTADELGLYAVVRPGPYINAEVSGGGFPAWLKTVPGRARSFEPGYREAYRDWLRHINPIIARHQVTRGGPVIAYNVENEYAVNVDRAYMEDLQLQARAAGIDVPITHNQCCDAAPWTADWARGQGAVQIPGVDDYPQSFECQTPDVWGPWGQGVTERPRDDHPVYAAEYQAGAIDLNRAGYDRCRELTGPSYMKFFYKNNLITSGATMYGYYMAYGGTNWGRLAQPNDVYTSYDYGAAITEPRQLTAKYDEFKRQGYFVTSVAPLTRTDPADGPASSNPAITATARANPDTGTQFVLVRHTDRAATTDDSAVLDWATPDGRYAAPVRVNGRDAKVLVAGYDLGGQRLAWSTSELMTHAFIGGRDVALFYGREGEAGSTVLRYPSRPTVRVLAGAVTSSYDNGDLRLDYRHEGLARVLVSGGGRRPLLLLLGTDQAAAQFWRLDTNAGPILVRGTSLARSAHVAGGTIWLRADTAADGEVEVFAPTSARRLVIGSRGHSGSNGTWASHVPYDASWDAHMPSRPTPSGSLVGRVRGPEAVRLPELTGWRYRAEAPEADPRFDDSRWTVADKTTTLSPIKPMTLPVLYADEYGYHYGHVWFRGRFTATGAESSLRLNAITGKNGIYQVWLNGRYLGSAAGGTQLDTDPDNPTPNPDPGRGDFPIPAGLLAPGSTATLAVLVENMGHNDDWIANDARFRQPRGLLGVRVLDADGPTGVPIAWRIQGARGGEDLADRVRGPLNNGGLFGERSGWHLPGEACSQGRAIEHCPDRGWQRIGSPANGQLTPGVSWYRTEFELNLPRAHDVSVGLRFGGDTARRYRVLIFLNGWAVGEYTNDLGPQRDFYLPAGLLRGRGDNTLALAVVARDAAPGGPGPVSLVALANHRGGVPVRDVHSPGFHR